MNSFSSIPASERPRERLHQVGPQALSDKELLAIILGSGLRGRNVLQLAEDCLNYIDKTPASDLSSKLLSVSGMGPAKAALIMAALEFARRRIRPLGVKISEAKDVYPLVRHLADRKQEHFVAISLNGAHEVIAVRIVTIGLVNSTQVHPREVFSEPICDRACAVIVAHNHPSGSLTPSEEDKKVTASLKEASKILGIKLLDHIIFSQTSFLSFAEENIL